MKRKSSLFSALLILAMLFSFFAFAAGDVRADERSFTNVKIDNAGMMTWDPIDTDHYGVIIKSPSIGIHTGTSESGIDLFQNLVSAKSVNGICSIEMTATDRSGNTYKWNGSYSFTNPNAQLAAPVNVRIEGSYLVWDYDYSVAPDAKIMFDVMVSRRMDRDYWGDTGYARTYDNRVFIGGIIESGTYDYRVRIDAESLNTENPRNYVLQTFYGVTLEAPKISNLRCEDGIVKWDPVEGANEYYFYYHYKNDGVDDYRTLSVTAPRFDLKKVLGEGKYDMYIDVRAQYVGDKNSYKNRYPYWHLTETASLYFDYEFDGYGLEVFGVPVTSKTDLNDLLGDGGSIRYDYEEKKLTFDSLTNEDLQKVDPTVYDKNAPLIRSEGSLNITGSAAVKLRGPFIESKLDLTFNPNSSFKIVSEDSHVIESRNIWLQGGSFTFKGKGSDIIGTYDYITISDGTRKLEVESTNGGNAMKCGSVNTDGKITIPDSMKIYIPENGKLSNNLKTITTSDGHAVSKVYISKVAPTSTPTPSPTVTPVVTPTSKPAPTTAPGVKPTKAPSSAPTAAPGKKPTVAPATPVAKPTLSQPGVTNAPAVTTTAPVSTATPTPTPVPAEQKSQILSFVERLYTCVLDREPEVDGANYWSDELYGFRRTGAEVAQGFIFSPEFEARGTSDEEFVTILYNTFFDREPEEDGIGYWLNQLSTGAMDRATVANGFIYSQEWADTCASYGIRSGGDLKPNGSIEPTALTYSFVERMYTTCMGRGYDEEGKQYWASELSNFRVTGEVCGASFFLSEEMNSYGLSDEEFLNRLYLTFMDRESDADGAAYWLGVMASGTPRADVVFGFTRSPEFTEKCIEARILPY